MNTLCDAGTGHTVTLSQATLVEAVATICRKARESTSTHKITLEERDKLIALFRKDVDKQYDIAKVTAKLYKNAGNLCRIYPLRSYDAVQLACALATKTRLVDSGLSEPIFISADNRLLDIAYMEGFAVDNPNNHP